MRKLLRVRKLNLLVRVGGGAPQFARLSHGNIRYDMERGHTGTLLDCIINQYQSIEVYSIPSSKPYTSMD
jgi:hypothetical protein